jgi:TRAP-type C4-dicarboxylate transport system permease large subunit
MNVGGITDRLVHLSRTMVGNFPGALAQINVLLSVFFAGISGSSTAGRREPGQDLHRGAGEGGLRPVVLDRDHGGFRGAGGDHPAVDPDGRLGRRMQVSIGALYLAGVIPGLLIGLAQMATVHVYAKVRNYPDVSARDAQEFFRPRRSRSRAVDAVHHRRRHPARLVHGHRVGGRGRDLRAVLSSVFYREMDSRRLWHALLETGKLSAIALFCVGTASVFGWLLAYYQIPKALLANVTTWGLGSIGVGFFIVFVFLVVGCFLDAIPAIIIVGTVLQPLAESVHMHPVSLRDHQHRRAGVRPGDAALRLCLMISCAIAKVRLRYALKDTMIMLVPMLLVLSAMVIWPQIPLWLPELIRPDFLK